MTINPLDHFSQQDLQDTFVTACEGGVQDWATVDRYDPDRCTARLFDLVGFDEGATRGNEALSTYALDLGTIRTGIAKVFEPGFSIRADILEAIRVLDVEPIDAEAAQCIIQAALFGELLYA